MEKKESNLQENQMSFFGELTQDDVTVGDLSDVGQSLMDPPSPDDDPIKKEESNILGDLFGDDTTDSNTEEGKTGEEENNKSETGIVDVVKHLINNELIPAELGDEELTEDSARELFERGQESLLEERVLELFKDLDPFTRELNRFVIDGGDPVEFFNKHKGGYDPLANVDSGNPADLEKLLRSRYKGEGLDTEEIDAKIDFLKDRGQIEKFGLKEFERRKKGREDKEADMVRSNQEAKERRHQNYLKNREQISNTLKESKDILGFPLTRNDKRDLPDYISKKSIKLKGGGAISQRDYDLHKAMSDPAKNLFISKLVKSDFDMKSVMKVLESKANRTAEKSLSTERSNTPSSSAKLKEGSLKSLAELLD